MNNEQGILRWDAHLGFHGDLYPTKGDVITYIIAGEGGSPVIKLF